jgi:hypothetical protein
VSETEVVGANRRPVLLSAITGWAEKVGARTDGSNPCRHVERFPENARERLPKRAAWVAARQPAEDWRAVTALRLPIFTGVRLSKVECGPTPAGAATFLRRIKNV